MLDRTGSGGINKYLQPFFREGGESALLFHSFGSLAALFQVEHRCSREERIEGGGEEGRQVVSYVNSKV